MKKVLFIIGILLVGGSIATIHTGCEEDPKEACQQDMFCNDSVAVSACCTDGKDCYYTYNGKEYPDTDEGLNQLIEDLDCTTAKASDIESVDGELILRLQSLLKEARIRSKKEN